LPPAYCQLPPIDSPETGFNKELPLDNAALRGVKFSSLALKNIPVRTPLGTEAALPVADKVTVSVVPLRLKDDMAVLPAFAETPANNSAAAQASPVTPFGIRADFCVIV
jgi:hypothetical protein